MRTTILVCLALGCGWPAAAAEKAGPRYERRWLYASTNLLVDRNVEALTALLARAGKSGYNGVVLADYKFNILGRMPPRYFQNVERVKRAARAAGLEIIPAVFPVGYSSGLLANDPNLAEGLPVEDAPFIVRGREAVHDRSRAARLINGDLEDVRGDRFTKFSLQDGPGKVTFADRKVVHGGKVSCRMENVRKGPHGHARLAQRVKVRPHACYRLSCWVKTRDFGPSGAFNLLALSTREGNRKLTFFEVRLKKTQDWQRLEVVFNSLGENEVLVYAGQWGGRTGTLWLDDLALEELGLINVLRRAGCPLRVADADGKTLYEEGKDFLPVRDSRLGQDPYAGEFSFRHPGPPIRLTDTSRIKDGQRLKVSWYHPVIVHGEQVCCCLSEPKVFELLRDQAKRVNELFRPKTFLMSHDEIRVAGWCRTCRATDKTPGQLLADNVRRCAAILKEINPKAQIAVWSDMFDPHHNAVKNYYLVKSTLEGSWKGLPPDVLILNWNGDRPAESLKWFAGRGHAQVIAGYYDSSVSTFKNWDTAAKGVPKVVGFMYTTWANKYADLEAYGKLMLGKD